MTFKEEYQALEERNKRLNEICQRFINEVTPLVQNNTDGNNPPSKIPVFKNVNAVIDTLEQAEITIKGMFNNEN